MHLREPFLRGWMSKDQGVPSVPAGLPTQRAFKSKLQKFFCLLPGGSVSGAIAMKL